MRRYINRRKAGVSLVELSAALVLGFPLVFSMIYAALEANLYFTIRTNLDVATRRAAQLLIDHYVTTGTKDADTTNGNLPSGLAFDVYNGQGKYFINKSANQFTWTWDTSSKPTTVTVTTSYPTSGSSTYSLMTFPSPDPLNLKSKFTIYTSATFAVPPFN